jgi:PKD repeat protein
MLMAGRLTVSKALPLVVLVLLVLSVVPAGVASLEVSDPVNVTDDSDPNGSARLDVDSDGNYHMLYLTDTGGTYPELMYRKIDNTGSTKEGPTRLSPTSVDSAFGQIAIAVDTGGRAHIAFSVKLDNDDTRDVYYAQVGADGSVKVAARNVYTSEYSASSLDVEADSSGNAYIVWNEREDPPTIMWIKLSSSGSVSRSAQEISGSLGFGGDLYFPRLGASSSGTTYIAWQQKNNQLERDSIWYTSLDSVGDEREAPREVQSNAAFDLQYLEATANNQGDLYIVYEENNAIEYAIIDDNGGATGGSQIAGSLLGEATAPDVAIAPNGDVYVVYMFRDNIVSSPWHAYARVLWDSNDTWSPAVELDDGQASNAVVIAAGPIDAGAVFQRNNDLHFVALTPSQENNPPTASLSFSPSDPGIDELVTFDGSDSTDPDDDDFVDEYFFDYGDGGDSGWITSSSAVHSYTAAGTYTARLRVRDSHGLESDNQDSVSVRVASTPSNKAPTAVLTASPTSVEVGKTVTFNGDSSSDPDGLVQFWRFNYGDGVDSGWVANSVTTHSYNNQGVYTATLQVKDDDGAVSENTALITITAIETNEPPTATIDSITPNPALEGVDVTFIGTGVDSDGTIETFSWVSNLDLLLSSESTFVHSALTVGVHTITFKVKDDDGEWSEEATAVLTITANSPPTLQDITGKTKAKTDTPVEFRVVYTDKDNDRPTAARLYYSKGGQGDYKAQVLSEVDAADKDYTDGKEYFFTMRLKSEGKWKYYFEFENFKNPKKKTPVTEIDVEEVSGPIPAPGAGLVMGTLLMAAIAVAVLGRRREGRNPAR